MRNIILAAWTAAISAALAVEAGAQETYELRVPGTATRSTAYLSSSELAIVHQGRTTRYVRDRQFDGEGHFGFSNRDLRRVIRWPQLGRGVFQIGDIRGPQVSFRASQMEIIPRAPAVLPVAPLPGAGLGGSGAVDARFYYQLTSLACAKQGQLLQAEPLRGRAEMEVADPARPSGSYWQLADAGRGAFRLQSPSYPGMSLTASAGTVFLHLENTANDPRQLWRLERAADGYFQILNLAADNRGSALDSDGRTGATLEERVRQRRVIDPVTGAARLVEESYRVEVPRPGVVFMSKAGRVAGQMWRLTWGPLIADPLDVPGARRLVSRRLVPQSALPPARVELLNSTGKELWVLWENLGDRTGQRIRIPPRGAVEVTVPRDPGQVFEVVREVRRTSFGGGQWVRQTERVAAPPEPLIRLSAYQLAVQSLVRDSTPAGGGRVEEVGYSPRSVGMFLLPAGDGVRPGEQIDVFSAASQAGNPGAVTRIDPERWAPTPKPEDPLEKILRRQRP